MSNTINYFMWAYQTHFWGTQRRFVNDVFGRLGLEIEPEVFLVGVLTEARNDRHDYCVEPEDGGCWLDPELLHGSREDAANLISEYPEARMMFSDSRSSEMHLTFLSRLALRDALKQKIVSNPSKTKGYEYFFSELVPIDSYLVMMVVGIPDTVRLSFPKLDSKEYKIHESKSIQVPTCLIDAVVDELMNGATDILGRQNRENFHNSRGVDDLLRDAARSLVRSLAQRCDCFANTFGCESNLFDNLCRVAASLYEGSPALGTIVIAKKSHPKLVKRLEFSIPVDMSNTRGVRKLLELTRSKRYALHTNSNQVWGLIDSAKTEYRNDKEDLYEIRFTGTQRWECRHNGLILAHIENRIPKLPGQSIEAKKVKAELRRYFRSIDEEVVASYVKLVEACARQEHGALLVISTQAEAEAARLANQSTPIAPIRVDDSLFESISSIDGAVLLDTFGNCWAIGVILDGMACDGGNPARGSRYNSAIRYTSMKSRECVAFIVSEDGGVEMAPQLRPQVSRKAIDARIGQVRELARKEKIVRRILDHINWLDEHRFYLLQADCELLNTLVPEIEARWMTISKSSIRFSRSKFEFDKTFDPELYYLE